MRTRSAWLLALASVLALLGCSHENDDDRDAPSAESHDADGIVNVTWVQRQGDLIYREGSVPAFVLTTQDGVVQQPSRRDNDTWIWESLSEGPYVLRAGLRPCSGSCDFLGPRTDSCRDELTVEGEVDVHVRLTTGRACTISDLASYLLETADAETPAGQTTGYQGRQPQAYVLASGRIAYPHVGLTTWSTCAFEIESVRRVSDSLMRVVGQESTTNCSTQVKRRVVSERLTRTQARHGVEEIVVVSRSPRFVVQAEVQRILS